MMKGYDALVYLCQAGGNAGGHHSCADGHHNTRKCLTRSHMRKRVSFSINSEEH